MKDIQTKPVDSGAADGSGIPIPRICFVCECNEGRSAHMELAVRDRLRRRGLQADLCSAGFTQGQRIYDFRRGFLRERGIPEAEIVGHRPSVFGAAHAGADLILVAELPMVERLLRNHPELRGRVMTIRGFAQGRDPDNDLDKARAHIEDAAGHGMEEKVRLYNELETLADLIAERLAGGSFVPDQPG
ncbi:MAG TPA: hypothetical protein PLY68_10295 [Myxococcota bacterium]|nr:hypothetical protein [Myxococcota bacterium]HQP96568.1 hypothetical protein [Myxococcota bacterium]